MRAVGNIVTGDDTQTQIILNCDALPCILHLLGSDKEAIRKEAAWTISNITAGNREQVQAVIDANIFPALIDICTHSEFKTRKEVAWAITNATSGGTAEQIKYLVSAGCIPPMCELLTVMDTKIVQVALSGLDNILKSGEIQHAKPNPYAVLIEECFGKCSPVRPVARNWVGSITSLFRHAGLDKLEFLQSHEVKDIYEKAFYILEKYFNSEIEDCRVAPSVDNNQYQFNPEEVTRFQF